MKKSKDCSLMRNKKNISMCLEFTWSCRGSCNRNVKIKKNSAFDIVMNAFDTMKKSTKSLYKRCYLYQREELELVLKITEGEIAWKNDTSQWTFFRLDCMNTGQQGYYCFIIINYIHWGFYINSIQHLLSLMEKRHIYNSRTKLPNDLLEWFRENNYDISYYAMFRIFYDSVWTVKMDEIQVIEFRMKWLWLFFPHSIVFNIPTFANFSWTAARHISSVWFFTYCNAYPFFFYSSKTYGFCLIFYKI